MIRNAYGDQNDLGSTLLPLHNEMQSATMLSICYVVVRRGLDTNNDTKLAWPLSLVELCVVSTIYLP